MIDNYVNLGPSVCVSVIQAEDLAKVGDEIFGGLVLFLCEGRVASHQFAVSVSSLFMVATCFLLQETAKVW